VVLPALVRRTRQENKFPRSWAYAFGRPIDKLPDRFNGLSMLAPQSRLATLGAHIKHAHGLSRQSGKSHSLTHDGAASGIKGAINLKHG
jgi:hypothetical protein